MYSSFSRRTSNITRTRWIADSFANTGRRIRPDPISRDRAFELRIGASSPYDARYKLYLFSDGCAYRCAAVHLSSTFSFSFSRRERQDKKARAQLIFALASKRRPVLSSSSSLFSLFSRLDPTVIYFSAENSPQADSIRDEKRIRAVVSLASRSWPKLLAFSLGQLRARFPTLLLISHAPGSLHFSTGMAATKVKFLVREPKNR